MLVKSKRRRISFFGNVCVHLDLQQHFMIHDMMFFLVCVPSENIKDLCEYINMNLKRLRADWPQRPLCQHSCMET